jgi:hypothetical protein
MIKMIKKRINGKTIKLTKLYRTFLVEQKRRPRPAGRSAQGKDG